MILFPNPEEKEKRRQQRKKEKEEQKALFEQRKQGSKSMQSKNAEVRQSEKVKEFVNKIRDNEMSCPISQ